MNEGTMKEVNSKESKSGRLRILARGKNSQMKLQCLQKVQSNETPVSTKSTNIGILGRWFIKSTLYKRFLN